MDINLYESLICADIHVPGHSIKMMERMIEYGQRKRIHKVVIAGDYWNFDAISKYELKDHNLSLDKELKVGKAILERLTNNFEVYMICGNHDKRLTYALRGSLTLKDAMENINDKVKTFNTDFIHIKSGNRIFRICHINNYSTIKGKVVSGMSQDLQENIMSGHPHYFSIQTNKTGKFISVDIPCMCDPDQFEYKSQNTTNNPQWNHGFIHLRNGKIRMLTDFTF